MNFTQAVREKLARVEGMTILGLCVAMDPGGLWIMDARVLCWTPTLHRGTMRLNTTFATDSDAALDMKLDRFVGSQAKRSAASRELGMNGAYADDGQVSHLLIDGPLKRYEPDAASIARTTLRRQSRIDAVINLDTHDPDTPLEMSSGFTVSRGTDDDPRPRVTMNCATTWGSYDGRFVHIACDVPPATVMVNAVGRRIDELVHLPTRHEPGLEGVVNRRIRSVRPYVAPRVGEDRAVYDVDHLALETDADWKPLE